MGRSIRTTVRAGGRIVAGGVATALLIEIRDVGRLLSDLAVEAALGVAGLDRNLLHHRPLLTTAAAAITASLSTSASMGGTPLSRQAPLVGGLRLLEGCFRRGALEGRPDQEETARLEGADVQELTVDN
jgi:hypothetical protein